MPSIDRLIGTCAALLASLLLCAPASFAAEDARRYDRGLLWRVAQRGAPPCYLFGTLHHDDERVTRIAAPVQRAFSAARTVAIELIGDDDAVGKYRLAMLHQQPLLAELIGEADWPRYDALLAEHGLPPEARAHLKPWAALLTLLRPAQPPGVILDQLLLADARSRGKTLVALESIDQQIAAMDELPQDTQLALLRHAEAQYERIQQSVGALIEAYLERDLRALWRINADVMIGDEALALHNQRFLDSLLFERNSRFTERMTPLIDRGRCFVAFGALHLYGPRGVPALLAQRGYRVRRVY